jgi:N6-L-threonylcarbamoyladenine synthase
MIILGIDTSCDDTGIAVLKIEHCWGGKVGKLKILSNIVSSQVKLHAKYGGVYPALAKREHQKNLPIVFKKATKGISPSKIGLISVTVGPGLEPCLWPGINFAKDLAKKLNKALVPVNHIEAHILANFIGKSQTSKLKSQIFLTVCLVVSGGHTQLILMEGIGKYKLIGETRDDAAGECFDKVARILGLGYPGGPAIAKVAKKFPSQEAIASKYGIKLPRPMIYQKNYDFSFAGLKTAVLYDFRSRPSKVRKSKDYIGAMAAEVQRAIIDVLIYKTLKAAKEFKTKLIILGGGVAANDELRNQSKKICSRFHLEHLMPPKELCTDNAAMVALTAYFHRQEVTKDWQKIKAEANLKMLNKV